ncbi:MAG: GH92 family glycosyl hydrolase [Pseudomonadota bacterium]|uniref:GH92 family glycosyl hydrolase n=1 Tax=Gallaecimonas pentaromativorans TaxID=584787 RepID=UPI0009FA5E64|nr:GH92 family glycosyl hydrolase [Gallaecimonas pentaromativorans]MED5524928.1 GH92 family glycosyl hydrolase [Pseudomonadota bacterium]
MLRKSLLLALVTLPVLAAPAFADALADVDPFIGTGGDGHTFPGATLPFGMVQLSPDTDMPNFHHAYGWAAGYRYSDHSILGFSHTHFSGSGHSDLGDVLLMPMSGELHLDPGAKDQPGSGYRSRFSHQSERASPGYYAVTLDDNQVKAELTAGKRVGWHRYTFAKGAEARVLLDLRPSIYDYDGKVLWSSLRLRPDGVLTGMRQTRGWAPGRQLFFAMRFSKPLKGHQLLNREQNVSYRGFKGPGHNPGDVAAISGRALEAALDFGPLNSPLLVKVAISSVSEQGALDNLSKEASGWDFDGAKTAAQAQWQKALGAIDIKAPAPIRRSFYTALYHALIAPNLASDADGRYRGPDQEVHQAKGFDFYSTWSLWDVYRAQQPLLTILEPKRMGELVSSLVAAQQSSPFGILPVWSYQGQETWCMIGYHALPVIADAYLKGITGFDSAAALKAMVASADYGPYGDLSDYIKLGYVPIDKEPEAASKTLEYAFDDWTLARMASAMGKDALAKRFFKRAGNWQNVFDRQTGFARARLSNGDYRTPFDPAAVGYGSDYTEGNAWQYSWYVPQDIAGLIDAMGGQSAFVNKLDAVFDTKVDPKTFAHVEDISGLIGYYAHGNEPSHHMAYLYDYAGAPWKTQERLTTIMNSQYHDGPSGLAGNDDLGQMSAWYLFTAMGFYPVAPGSNQYVLGRPFVEEASIRLPGGKRFVVKAEHLDDAHPYVGKVLLNGKALATSYITHQDLVAGGILTFVMQQSPNKNWATGPASRPYSLSR